MKKISIVLAMLVFSAKATAQSYPAYDTLRKNEFSLNTSPTLLLLMGGMSDNYTNNFSLGYKHYFKNRVVFRSSFLIFPNANYSYYNGIPEFYSSVGNKNIFRSTYTGGGVKTQISFGAEKIFRVNRLQHGLGAEVFANHKFVNRTDAYFYIYDSLTAPLYYQMPNPISNSVDSLGSNYNGRSIGVGLQAFYSLRYKISKHWYLSATVGPGANFSFVSGTLNDKRKKETYNLNSYDFQIPNVPFVSDVSIAFRF